MSYNELYLLIIISADSGSGYRVPADQVLLQDHRQHPAVAGYPGQVPVRLVHGRDGHLPGTARPARTKPPFQTSAVAVTLPAVLRGTELGAGRLRRAAVETREGSGRGAGGAGGRGESGRELR